MNSFRTTILFGGVNRERLVSVASAQALAEALPEADLWFWDPQGVVRACDRAVLMGHARPFEIDLPVTEGAIGPIETALAQAKQDGRVLVLGLHGGMAENGELAALCEARGIPFTGSGSAASRLAFDKRAAKKAAAAADVPMVQTLALDELASALQRYGKLVAKPAEDGSSYGLFFIDSPDQVASVAERIGNEAYVFEPFVAGLEATCGVLEQDGAIVALPPVEIRPAEGVFDYAAKYLAAATQEICPATFDPAVNAALQEAALKAHKAVGARGYSRSDFVVTPNGIVFLEINTLPGLTRASLYPKALAAQGIPFAEFLRGQIRIAAARVA